MVLRTVTRCLNATRSDWEHRRLTNDASDQRQKKKRKNVHKGPFFDMRFGVRRLFQKREPFSTLLLMN
jgi:hypothetical protein